MADTDGNDTHTRAGAATFAVIINQSANCKRAQSASLVHEFSRACQARQGLKVESVGALQNPWLITTDGPNTVHRSGALKGGRPGPERRVTAAEPKAETGCLQL